MERISAGYERVLGWSLAHRKTVVALALASFLASFPLLKFVGSEFVFGALGIQGGGQLAVKAGDANGTAALGFVFAFQILPTIIFVATVMAVLFHLGIMQWVVKGMAWVMVRAMDTSGTESLAAAAEVFVGMTQGVCT